MTQKVNHDRRRQLALAKLYADHVKAQREAAKAVQPVEQTPKTA